MCTYLLELETGGTSTVGEGLDAAMVDTATTIESDLGDAGLDGTLANELTDLLRSLLVRGVGALNSASRVEAETSVRLEPCCRR